MYLVDVASLLHRYLHVGTPYISLSALVAVRIIPSLRSVILGKRIGQHLSHLCPLRLYCALLWILYLHAEAPSFASFSPDDYVIGVAQRFLLLLR